MSRVVKDDIQSISILSLVNGITWLPVLELFNNMRMVQYQNNVWARLEEETVQSVMPVCQMKMGKCTVQMLLLFFHGGGKAS